MPEKKLWTRHVGMETLNSVGSTGSCDSIESISSNHSAISGEGYEHLSAEERECLMFLEETIESLDNEDDSGLSNDELETTTKADSPNVSGNDKIPTKIAAVPKLEEWTKNNIDSNTVSQGHHSFPRVQVSKPESTKQPLDLNLGGIKKEQLKMQPEKPKRMSLINQQQAAEPPISDFLIIPPPEAFRDPKIVDKRHSVTDPTDSREVRFDRIVLKPAVISEHREAPATFKQSDKSPLFAIPRVSSPSKLTDETLNQVVEKPSDTQFKQGPPTAPKPRTLPPHIVIKTSRVDIPSLDPQKRPRTFSAHERSTDKANESVITTILHSKEQERARHEALQKLGLEEKPSSQENNLVPPSKMDLHTARIGVEQGKKEDKRKSVVLNQHEDSDPSKGIPVQPLVGPLKINIHTAPIGVEQGKKEDKRKSVVLNKQEDSDPSKGFPVQPLVVGPLKMTTSLPNEALTRNRLSMKSYVFEKADEPPLMNQKEAHSISHGPMASDIDGKSKRSGQRNTHEKPEERTTPALTNVQGVTGNSQNVKFDLYKNHSQLNIVTQTKTLTKEKITDEPDPAFRDTNPCYTDPPTLNQTQESHMNSVKLNSPSVHPFSVPEKNLVLGKTFDQKKIEHFQGSIGQEHKTGSLDNINIMSTSPRNRSSFSPPKEPQVSQHSPKVIRRDGKDRPPVDKSSRHSTHFEPSDEPYLRLPQGSVPGLRQINIKSNTLERSGVGLSSSLPSIDKGSNSFFKKSIFSGNFLRNNRPRPASLGTGKDFANLEPGTTVADTTEKHSFFSRPSRQSGPVTSVKIAPKGSTDEHRRQALKKLGILKE